MDTYKKVLKLSYPVGTLLFSDSAMGVFDSWLCGGISTASQAAIGLGMLLSGSIFLVFITVLTINSSFVGQFYGKKQPEKCGWATWHALLISVFCSIMTLTAILLVRKAAPLLSKDHEVVQLAIGYTQIRFVGIALRLPLTVLNSFFNGLGKTRTPMRIGLLMMGINIPLSYLFVKGGLFVPAMGVPGTAWAYVISSMIGLTAGFVQFRSSTYRAEFGTIRPSVWSKTFIVQFLRTGIPLGVQWGLDFLAILVFASIIGHMGAVAFATHNIFLRLYYFFSIPFFSIATGTSILVAQSLGMKQSDAAWNYAKVAYKMLTLYAVVISVALVFLSKWIGGFFSHDPSVIDEVSRLVLWVTLPYYMAELFVRVSSGILRGAGDTKTPMKISLVVSWAIFVPLTWLGSTFLKGGLLGGWIGAALAWTISAMIFITIVKRKRWMDRSLV